jgi:hypothetical protein
MINGKIYPLPAKVTQELNIWIDKMLTFGNRAKGPMVRLVLVVTNVCINKHVYRFSAAKRSPNLAIPALANRNGCLNSRWRLVYVYGIGLGVL